VHRFAMNNRTIFCVARLAIASVQFHALAGDAKKGFFYNLNVRRNRPMTGGRGPLATDPG
jgi:hypothetical protein